MWTPLDLLSPETWVLIASMLVLGKYYMHRKWQYLSSMNIPHDPPSLMKFGHFFSLLDSKECFEIDNRMKKKYGPIWGAYALFSPMITVHDPDILRQIFIKEFQSFSIRQDRLTKIRGKEMNDSLISVNGKQWKRIRSSLTPTFSSAKLKKMVYIMDHCVDNAAKALDRKIENTHGIFDAKTIFSRLSLDIVCSGAFSTEVNSQDDSVKEPEIARQAKKLVDVSAGSKLMIFCFLFPPVEKLVEYLDISIFGGETVQYFKALTNHVVKQRESNPHQENHKVDMMQLMLNSEISDKDANADLVKKGLTRNEIIGNAMLMITGGYEITGYTMCFLAYNLAMYQDVQKKLQEEIDEMFKCRGKFDYESVNSLKYMDMCLNETQRIYFPTLRNARICEKETTINGLTIPKGVMISIPSYALAHDPDYWDEPEKFKPERMSDMSEIDPMMFQPFGAGPRSCIAMRFALAEIKVCLSKLLHEFTFEPTENTPKPPLKLTSGMGIRPTENFDLRAVRRRNV